ncbi:MAG: RNA polymerase sigma factor [Deltaproteobacteria bacterium]|nr:MAG: RNA polymerase sigma factor [Deltaproteobacteria bacterium]
MTSDIAGESSIVWVERAQRGEAEAFQVLARAFLRPAYAVALSVVGRPEDAEDIAQDAIVTALGRIATLRQNERFSAWLMTIVRNRSKNLLDQRRRREGRGVAEDDAPPVAPPRTENIGLRERLLAALETLPPAQREVVLLHDLEGWTHAEIANSLGTSEGMSRQHLFHARRALRRRIQE